MQSMQGPLWDVLAISSVFVDDRDAPIDLEREREREMPVYPPVILSFYNDLDERSKEFTPCSCKDTICFVFPVEFPRFSKTVWLQKKEAKMWKKKKRIRRCFGTNGRSAEARKREVIAWSIEER